MEMIMNLNAKLKQKKVSSKGKLHKRASERRGKGERRNPLSLLSRLFLWIGCGMHACISTVRGGKALTALDNVYS